MRPRDASEAEGRCKVRPGFVVGALRDAWLRCLERSGAPGFGAWSSQGRLASVVGALRGAWLRWLERSGAPGFGAWSSQARLASVVGALRGAWLRWPREMRDEAERVRGEAEGDAR